jgi:hypothetical protein
MSDEPAKTGRPTLYDPAFGERVITLGKEGASVVEMATTLGVSRTTMETNWTAAHPDFAEALEMARQHAQVWWERKGRDGMSQPGFQGNVWSRSMAARFPNDWRETHRNELTGAGGAPIATKATADVSGLNEDQLRVLATIPLKSDGEAAGPARH